MSRYKGLTSGKLSLRCYNAQVGECQSYKQSHRTRYACSKLTASYIWRRWSLSRFDQQRLIEAEIWPVDIDEVRIT